MSVPAAGALGVLLVNLGTPAAPTEAAVRRYLAQFLADPRVVQIPRIFWLPLLHGLVLRSRPRRSAARYAAIWTAEGSPLAVHTQRQASLLRTALPACRVEYAMRYGEPSIHRGLARLSSCTRRLVLPLYPQYSRSTTEAVRDALPAGTALIEDFHAHPAYIEALAAGIEDYWKTHGRPDVVLFSFHGLPQRAVKQGDPYRTQCELTVQLLAQKLRLGRDAYRLCFQSRFGRAAWLQPYTASLLVELGNRGVRRVDVACPGFVSDCLETLEEIGIDGRASFLRAGGTEFHALPCLNESPRWISALARIISEHAGGHDSLPGRCYADRDP